MNNNNNEKFSKNLILDARLKEISTDETKSTILANIKDSAEFKLLSRNVQDFYLYSILIHLDSQPQNSEKILLSQYLVSLGFTEVDATKTIDSLYPYLLEKINYFIGKESDITAALFSSDELDSEANFDAFIYLSTEDIKQLSLFLQEDQDKYSEEVFKLLISFTAFARSNPHPNGWIKYDQKSKDLIFYLASCTKKDQKYKEYLTNTLHLNYNLNMRVVGSTQPIPCFQLAWQLPLKDQSVLVKIGENSPETIDTFYRVLCCNKDIWGTI